MNATIQHFFSVCLRRGLGPTRDSQDMSLQELLIFSQIDHRQRSKNACVKSEIQQKSLSVYVEVLDLLHILEI